MSNEILISNLVAREILDARGIPTLEVTIYLNNQAMVIASISTSHEINDFIESATNKGNNGHMGGMGMQKALDQINQQIAPQLINQNPVNQELIDSLITKANPSQSHVNTNMVVSMAVLKAAAITYGWPNYYYIWKRYQLTQTLKLPTCLFGMFNGGELGEDNMDFAETQIIPAKNIPFSRSLEMAVLTFNNLKSILMAKGGGQATSSLGGFIPILPKNTDAFDLLVEAIRKSGLVMGRDLFFGVDFDSGHYFSLGKYKIKEITNSLNSTTMMDYLKKMHTNYGVYMFEDPFDSTDGSAWKKFSSEMGESIRLLGDKLTNSDTSSIKKVLDQKLCNTVLIKPGQINTITELVEIIKNIKIADSQFVIAHRQGETTDDLIADIAVGFGADYCKFGPPNRGERIAKYNRLLKIEEEVNQINAIVPQNTAPAAT